MQPEVRTPHGRVLETVHHDGPRSRAELAERLGVNRSTIAAHVAALVDAGLVEELAPASSGRVGRPSPVVSAHPGIVVVAVVPEFDALTIATVGLDARVAERRRLPPVREPDEAVEAIGAAVDALRARRAPTVVGIGVAVPGLVDAAGRVARAPRLGWVDVDLRTRIAERCGLPVAVGNDASLGAQAEHRFGAGRGASSMLYLNGGASGIGGGVVLDGRLLTGERGFAGEIGHASTARGELEAAVGRDALLAALGMRDDATEEALAEAMAASPAASGPGEVMEAQRTVLARSIADAVLLVDPAIVVLGGFLASYADADLVRRVRGATLPELTEHLALVPASLGTSRMLIGAAERAFAPLLADPLRAVRHG